MPRLNLRSLLLLSLLLGAVAIPWGYKYFKARREAEIERLTEELEEQRSILRDLEKPRGYWSEEESKRLKTQQTRVAEIEARLFELTGKKPERTMTIDEMPEPVITQSIDRPSDEVQKVDAVLSDRIF